MQSHKRPIGDGCAFLNFGGLRVVSGCASKFKVERLDCKFKCMCPWPRLGVVGVFRPFLFRKVGFGTKANLVAPLIAYRS